jgi:Ca2+-binding RTX toxin-like protein
MAARRIATLAVVLCALVLAPSASAGTAYVTGTGQAKVLHYDAGPGETNRPNISTIAGSGVISITDAAVTVGNGCSQVFTDSADCSDQGVASISVSLDDMDDLLQASVPMPTTVAMGGGNDQVWSLAGAGNSVDMGPGDDTIRGTSAGADSFTGGTGRDSIEYAGRTAALDVSLDDVANDGEATEGDNVHSDIEDVYGGSGPNTLTGSAADNRLGVVLYANAPDNIDGGGGNDTIDSGSAPSCDTPDVLTGGDGNDEITVGRAEVVDGGADDDTIHAGLECAGEVIDGGAGRDTADLGATGVDIVVTLDDQPNDGYLAGVQDMNVLAESVVGGYGNDILIGSDDPNEIDGYYGEDLIDGGGGADVLMGGGPPHEIDVVDYSFRTAPVHADLTGSPGDDGEAGEGDTIGSDVEGVYGGSGADVLTGNVNHNLIDGGLGADTISGGEGEDTVDYSLWTAGVVADPDGASGDDGEPGEGDSIAQDVENLVGGAGADVLRGNSQINWIWGSDGNDEIEGGGDFDWAFGDGGDDKLMMRDDFTDKAFCGDGEDLLDRDAVDFVDDDDCETQTPVADPRGGTQQPSPTAPPSTGTRPPTQPLVRDAKAPTLTATPARPHLTVALRSGLPVAIKCDEHCRSRILVRISAKQARALRINRKTRRSIVVAQGSHPGVDSGSYDLLAVFSTHYRSRLRKARKLTLQYTVVASDGSGNPATSKGTVTLKR